MQFSIKAVSAEKAKSDCLLLPVFRDNRLAPSATAIDVQTSGSIKKALSSGDLGAKVGATLTLLSVGSFTRVILVRMQGEGNLSKKQFQESCKSALRATLQTSARDCLSFLHEAEFSETGMNELLDWKIRTQVICLRELVYRADQWKSKPEPDHHKLGLFQLAVGKDQAAIAQVGLTHAMAIANGVDTAKNLGNSPANFCTPTQLAEQAKKLGRAEKIKVQVFNEKQIAALGMGSFLAVAQGSEQPPRLVVMEYRGGPAKQAPVALVGKGITFDTGGISLKPGAEMDEMKYDMCGAATVVGTLQAAAQLKLPINLIGVIVAAENMPSGKAVKPGDVVKSMSGQTIEILNTDAEGRLILCDALTFVARFKPSTVIDIATLTGACVIALGGVHSGLFTANSTLSNDLTQAGNYTGDTCWPMPLDDEYHEGLKSNFADMANIAGRAGGAITAACFLAKFAKGYEWAHLDIAGTAWKSGQAKGGTGRPVPLLTQYLINRCQA
jgi:leucyl aminopeptidase